MPFDPAAQALDSHDLRIRQDWHALPLGRERQCLRTAVCQRTVATFLACDGR